MVRRNVHPLLGKHHELGHPAIDLEHRTMAECWIRAVNCEPIQFPFFMARLKNVMRKHFDHEAVLMAQAGGRLCECHGREHRMLLELCDQTAALAGRNWRKAQSRLRNELPRLVREHIICMDQIAVLFIHTYEERIRAS